MRRHSADPDGCYVPKVVAVIRPFVKDNLDDPATQEHSQRKKDRHGVDTVQIVIEGAADALYPEEGAEQAYGIARPVPPEVDRHDFPDDGVNLMNKRAAHAAIITVVRSCPMAADPEGAMVSHASANGREQPADGLKQKRPC